MNKTVLVDTRWKTRLEITTDDVSIKSNCSEKDLSMHFKEHGIYAINVTADAKLNCSVQLRTSPKSSFIALYAAAGIFFAVALIWCLFSKYYWVKLCRKINSNDGEYEPLIDQVTISHDGSLKHSGLISSVSLTSSTEIHVSGKHDATQNLQGVRGSPDAKSKKERLKSLDTFRGISIVIMVFVNYGGGGYWFFSHSKWNGLTVADLVFPWFVFIMGTSMIYSFTSLLKNETPKHKIFWKILRRSCILFILGLVINTNGSSSVYMTELRIPGVLQRFAMTYLITATVHMCVAKLPDTMTETRFKDITDYWSEWIIISLFILVHTCLTFLLPVRGCEKGYLGPGGLENYGKHHNCTGGAAGYIDRQVFGEKHIFGSPTCKEIYHNDLPHEPEGLLGTLTSCVLCFLGLQAGKILCTYKSRSARVVRFCLWGIVLCLLAGILCKFSKNEGWIPVNKNLWSLSFVFCLGGFAFFLLCFCYLMIDEWKIWNGAPFYYPGMNAILVYMGHELLHKNFPVSWHVPETHASHLAIDLYGASLWVIVATYLYYKKSFYVI
ncbi:heparan-alpha-glucosaminide N-acetyltransferase-like [Mytilus californianus]|uniref:heparan-alpha-glucosaminide N-acetyltransferase-like n=1 Tax=Mytilus californianus TaxID=6549 RepID=UPI0022473B6F|nr:heparan-alpha-glucosaminide N-acetyltransferase-like [Mytilus californianus]